MFRHCRRLSTRTFSVAGLSSSESQHDDSSFEASVIKRISSKVASISTSLFMGVAMAELKHTIDLSTDSASSSDADARELAALGKKAVLRVRTVLHSCVTS